MRPSTDVSARNAWGNDEVVTHNYRGRVGGGDSTVTIHFHGRQRFSHDCEAFFDGSTGLHMLSDHGDPSAAGSELHAALDGADLWLSDTAVRKGRTLGGPVFSPYVDAVLPIQATLDGQLALLHSHGMHKKLTGLLRRGFAWHVSTRPADFDHFYSHMYLPTIWSRFGGSDGLFPRDDMEALFQSTGALLFACADDGTPEAGALLCATPQRPWSLRCCAAGVAQYGSLSAHEVSDQYARLDAAILQYAVKERFREADFGATRALADDGVFVHKRRLGCLFQRNPTYLGAEIRVKPSAAALFLLRRPIAVWRDDQLMFWTGQDGELDDHGAGLLREKILACTFPQVHSVTLFTRGVERSRTRLMKVVAEAQERHPCIIEFAESA